MTVRYGKSVQRISVAARISPGPCHLKRYREAIRRSVMSVFAIFGPNLLQLVTPDYLIVNLARIGPRVTTLAKSF